MPGAARSLPGAIYVDDVALIETGQPGPSAFDPVPTPRKEAWEQAQGGKEAARAHRRPAARLAGLAHRRRAAGRR